MTFHYLMSNESVFPFDILAIGYAVIEKNKQSLLLRLQHLCHF